MKFEIDFQLTVRASEPAGEDAIARISDLLDASQVSRRAIFELEGSRPRALRFTTSEGARAQRVLAENGFASSLEPVLAIPFGASRGALSAATNALARCGVAVDYIYPAFDPANQEARLILKASNIPLAARVLQEIGTAA